MKMYNTYIYRNFFIVLFKMKGTRIYAYFDNIRFLLNIKRYLKHITLHSLKFSMSKFSMRDEFQTYI